MPRACSGVRLISHRHCALNRVNFVGMILPTVESLVRSRSALPLDNPFRLILRCGQLRANGDIALAGKPFFYVGRYDIAQCVSYFSGEYGRTRR